MNKVALSWKICPNRNKRTIIEPSRTKIYGSAVMCLRERWLKRHMTQCLSDFKSKVPSCILDPFPFQRPWQYTFILINGQCYVGPTTYIIDYFIAILWCPTVLYCLSVRQNLIHWNTNRDIFERKIRKGLLAKKFIYNTLEISVDRQGNTT